jgi:hypothetical protein
VRWENRIKELRPIASVLSVARKSLMVCRKCSMSAGFRLSLRMSSRLALTLRANADDQCRGALATAATRRSAEGRRGLRWDSACHAAGAPRYPVNAVCIFASNQLLTFAKLGLSAIDSPRVDRCSTSMRVLTSSGAEASA